MQKNSVCQYINKNKNNLNAVMIDYAVYVVKQEQSDVYKIHEFAYNTEVTNAKEM